MQSNSEAPALANPVLPRRAPCKQGHTAHRVFVRIQQELPNSELSEVTVRRYVRVKKQALGLLARETFVPQSYGCGDEAQVDL